MIKKKIKMKNRILRFNDFRKINESFRLGNSDWSEILQDLEYEGWEIDGDSAKKYYSNDDDDARTIELRGEDNSEMVEYIIYDENDIEIDGGEFDASGLSAGELNSEVWNHVTDGNDNDDENF
jgi:hypothetical protein